MECCRDCKYVVSMNDYSILESLFGAISNRDKKCNNGKSYWYGISRSQYHSCDKFEEK